MKQYKCEECHDTGWYGDNGPGIKGNREYQRCECMAETKMRICPMCEGAGVLKERINHEKIKHPWLTILRNITLGKAK